MVQEPEQSSSEKCPIYEIRLAGQLHARWFGWFDGFQVNNLECGEVLLRGEIQDQSALHGVLEKIRNLNLELISVIRV